MSNSFLLDVVGRTAAIRPRRIVLLAVAILATLTSGALAAGDAVTISVTEQAGGPIVIDYTIGDYALESVRIDGQAYVQVRLDGEAASYEVGAPALPRVARSVIIPDDAQMSLRVTDARFEDITDINVAPSKGLLPRTVNPADVPYTFGETYHQDAFYPAEVATLGDPYILRDYRGAVVTINPYQYNPVTRTLRVYSSMTVEVVNAGPGKVNVLDRSREERALSLAFHHMYGAHFLNYDLGERYAPLGEEGDMLIIVHDAWIPNVQALADHKNGIGINTTVVGVSTIGVSSGAIKNYIQSRYDTSDLAFVLLVGDAAQIPTPSASGGSSDPSYSKLAGGDNYPDILVGRFSAENAGQVDTQVMRTIDYEALGATTQDWFMKGTGIASNQGPGDDGEYDNQHMNYIRDDLLDYGYTLVDQIYDPTGTATQVANALNQGRGIINYTGHGSVQDWSSTGFSITHINNLTNVGMLPFITSVACVNGQFASGTCFAEAWLRATHSGEPTGAIGIYASSINQSWDPPMAGQDEIIDMYVSESYVSLGALCFAGSCLMMDEYGGGGVEMFDTWHVFGDPSLRVVGTVGPPHGMKVSPSSGLAAEGQTGGPFTPNSIEYVISNLNALGSINFQVNKTQPWVSLSATTGTLAPGQTATVVASLNTQAGALPNGLHTDTVQFTNTTDHDGDTTRTISVKVGVPTVQHAWTLDSNPGWTMNGEWAFGHPTGSGGSHGHADPANGATGANVCGINLNGDYSATSGGPQYLTTGAIDCTGLSEVTLRFQRWLNTDYQTYVYAKIEASNNGSNWVSIWDNGTSEIADSSWSQKVYDITAVAGNQPTVYIRWSHQVSGSGAYAYSGWNIDDVEIWGLGAGGGCQSTATCPNADVNCDNMTDGFDIAAIRNTSNWLKPVGECEELRTDVNGDGMVDGFDIAVVRNTECWLQ